MDLHSAFTLIKVSRPLASWPSGVLLFLIGVQASGEPFTLGLLPQLLPLILFPIVIFGLNDVYDYETDKLSKRKNSLLEGKVLEKDKRTLILRASAVSSVILVLFSLSTRNPTHLFATGSSLFLAYAYSAPPIRLKGRPVLDSMSNAAAGTLVLMLGFSQGGTIFEFPAKLLWASLIIGAIHAIGALMDYTADKKAGISTIATFFGKRFAAAFSALLTAAILIFSGIKSTALNAFFLMWLLLSIFCLAWPDERLMRKLILASYAFAVIAMLLYLYQQVF